MKTGNTNETSSYASGYFFKGYLFQRGMSFWMEVDKPAVYKGWLQILEVTPDSHFTVFNPIDRTQFILYFNDIQYFDGTKINVIRREIYH